MIVALYEYSSYGRAGGHCLIKDPRVRSMSIEQGIISILAHDEGQALKNASTKRNAFIMLLLP